MPTAGHQSRRREGNDREEDQRQTPMGTVGEQVCERPPRPPQEPGSGRAGERSAAQASGVRLNARPWGDHRRRGVARALPAVSRVSHRRGHCAGVGWDAMSTTVRTATAVALDGVTRVLLPRRRRARLRGDPRLPAGQLHRDHGPVRLRKSTLLPGRRRPGPADPWRVVIGGTPPAGWTRPFYEVRRPRWASSSSPTTCSTRSRRTRTSPPAGSRAGARRPGGGPGRYARSVWRTWRGAVRRSCPAVSSGGWRSFAPCTCVQVVFADEPTGASWTGGRAGRSRAGARGLRRAGPGGRDGHPRPASRRPTPTACCSSPTGWSSAVSTALTPRASPPRDERAER